MKFKLIFVILIMVIFSVIYFTNNSNTNLFNSSSKDIINASNNINNGNNLEKSQMDISNFSIYNLKLVGDIFYFDSKFENKNTYVNILRSDNNYACDLISNFTIKPGKNVINLTNCKFEKGISYIFDISINNVDKKFNLTATKNSDNLWPKQKFYENGNIAQEIFLDGNWSKYTYDKFGNLKETKKSNLDVWKYNYDVNGTLLNLTKKFKDGNWTTIIYDASGVSSSVRFSKNNPNKFLI